MADAVSFGRLSTYRQGEMSEPLEVDLRFGEFRLVGGVENIYAGVLLHFRYATVKLETA